MAPIVHGLEAKYSDQMNFVYLDIDDPANDRFKQQLGFTFQPQFLLLDGEGNVLKQFAGIVPEEVLEDAIVTAVGDSY